MKALKGAVVVLLVVCLSGCAVGMALHGKREPQLTDLRKGMDIDEAHFIMRDYTPAVSLTEGGDRIEAYKIEMGNKPSGGRAFGNGCPYLWSLGNHRNAHGRFYKRNNEYENNL